MSIKQFNGHWMSEKDRLMIRFNTMDDCEYRLWLTRHLLKKIFQVGLDLIKPSQEKYDQNTSKIIQKMNLDVLQKSTNLKGQYENASKFPIGQVPVLVVGVDVESNEKFANIDLHLITKQKLNIKITKQIWGRFIILLNKLQKDAGWDLSLEGQQELVGNSDEEAIQVTLH